jgi:hypothetical protein
VAWTTNYTWENSTWSIISSKASLREMKAISYCLLNSIHSWKAKGNIFTKDKEMQSGRNYLDHSSSIVADKGLNVLLGHLC